VISNFHLLLYKVLRLDERANELFTLLSLQVPHLVLVYYTGNFELLLLCLEFVLLVDQLLPQDALLVIQVQED
jgi:hypothetical protein